MDAIDAGSVMQTDAAVPLGGETGPDISQSTTPPSRWRRLGAGLRALWYRRSVRAQLLITVVVIDLIAALVAGGVTILKARTATRVEITASMKLAELLVTETISLMRQEIAPEQLLQSLPLHLRFLRHVRIVVTDAAGGPVADTPAAGAPTPAAGAARGDERARAPGWFEALIAPSFERHELPVAVAGQRIGSVWVLGEPRDEIAEVWENTVALGAVAACVNLAVIGMLYFLFGRVLDPLTGIAAGLLDLERRHYKVRLRRPPARELAVMTDRFNALAEALDAARSENAGLTRRLITAQDDERRRTALELHDEVGPCLFGLKANAASIANAAGESGEAADRRIADRVGDILSIVEHLQTINRSLLNRLRPMALGHVPLRDLLADMVRDRARQHPDIAIAFSPGQLQGSYGDSLDLTVYRCVQESLTNVIRHAQAKGVAIALGERTDHESGSDDGAGPRLELTIRDDGRGLAPGTPKGFGLLGMEERVQALGGTFLIIGSAGGTCVHITMPIGITRAGSGDPAGLAGERT